jgi:UPF0755 protein
MTLTVKRGLIIAVLLLVACGIATGAWFAHYAYSDRVLPRSPLQFTLKAGSSLTSAARQMAEAGVLAHPGAFVLMARMLGEAGKVKAGNYEVEEAISPLTLLHKITRGDVTLDSITLVEGWTFKQMRQALDRHPALRHDTAGLAEGEILKRLGVEESAAEGWFFPSTYHFSSGSTDFTILRRAHQLMRAHLQAQWEARKPELPLANPYEALILASIIEKETGKATERPLIGAVFINRLRIGMRLQTDPTVIYGLGDGFDGNLRKRDLIADTPYNTYTRAGLPPTPIAMPGLDAIKAAVNPADSSMLYFVSRGDGTSHFSRTLGEHDQAVTKYQKSGQR